MRSSGRLYRIAVMLTVLCATAVAYSPRSTAADVNATAATAPALPPVATRETVRDLLSHLSDVQVRNLLIEQLDKTVADAVKPGADTGTAAMAGMAGTVDQHAGAMRSRYDTLYDALVALPATMRDVARRVAGSGVPVTPARLAAYVVALLMAGWVAERIYVHALRPYRARVLGAEAATFSARAFALGIGFLIDFGALLVFGVAAIVFFFSLWLPQELQRIFVLELLFAVFVVRVVALFARFLLANETGRARLLPFADAPARRMRGFAVALAVVYGVGFATSSVVGAASASAETVDVLGVGFWIVGLLVTLAGVWSARKPIADLIRGAGNRGAVVGWLAELWPVVASAYFVALLMSGLFNVLAGAAITTGTAFASVLLFVTLPIVDMALCRALAAATGNRGLVDTPEPRALGPYAPIFRRAVHVVVAVAGLILIARLWDLDLFAIAQRSLGGRIAGALLGIGVVVLATYMAWEIVTTAIDRRLSAEAELQDDVPATRLRTVLPILRATILVGIIVVASMSILAALGVDILPLLAGAGVVGLAIGFGSQTLVRDIVSGAFFLMDDAFRLGEYIEVGDAKGRVERINLRSMFLRHHRGALNILPYGEIKRLRNTSRDWSIHVMEFRLTYDTSMLQVKKIVKQIGDELAADPDYAPDLLQSLKSAGVIAAEDSAVVVRAKFTARPTSNAWVIRRVAYDKIIRAFRAAGIRFAHRQVTVNVPASADAGGAAAAAMASADAPGAPGTGAGG